MAPHDFLDGQWDQTDQAPPPGRSHRPARPARSPQGGRGRLTGAILALAIVVILAATAIALWTPREDTRTPIEVAAPTEQRSEERRVGKESGSRGWTLQLQ